MIQNGEVEEIKENIMDSRNMDRNIDCLPHHGVFKFDPYQQTITLHNVTIEPVIVLALASDQSDLFKGHDNDNSG